jgi:hypothetical protein
VLTFALDPSLDSSCGSPDLLLLVAIHKLLSLFLLVGLFGNFVKACFEEGFIKFVDLISYLLFS